MRRTMLFLPGNTPNMLINGDTLGADTIIFDLEDAVSPDEKDAARILVRNALRYQDRPIDVRFIEMMPIGYGRKYCGEETEDHVRHLLEKAYGKADSLSGRFGNGPSTYILPDGFKGKIGFISAISHKFCGDCNRVRLTSEGFLKPCLQFSHGADMRSLLRDGSSDEQIGAVAEKIIFEKPRSHRFGEAQEEGLENKKMSEIGG